MKILVAYYSRTGHNQKLANELAEDLGADIEEIIDLKSRKGIIGWIIGGKDSSTKQLTKIKTIEKDPADYDLVIVASPFWVGTAAPAIRQYMVQNRDKFKQIALASINAGGREQSSLTDAEQLLGQKISPSLFISDKEFRNDYSDKLNTFLASIKAK